MDHLIDDNDRLETCPFCGAEAEIISIAGETDDINTGRPTCVQCTSSAAVSVKKDRPPCNPMATQCPRCQNVLAECDHGSDLDLDDVAATSPKAKAELEALRAENARLRARISDLQKQISNDQHPPYSAPDPDRFY